MVLTHAHLDHCRYLPALVRQGFTGPVWATSGTAALADIILRDSARLQEEEEEEEAAYARSAGYSRHDPPLPLYTEDDAERAIGLLRSCGYGERVSLTSHASVSLHRARRFGGHPRLRRGPHGTGAAGYRPTPGPQGRFPMSRLPGQPDGLVHP